MSAANAESAELYRWLDHYCFEWEAAGDQLGRLQGMVQDAERRLEHFKKMKADAQRAIILHEREAAQ